MTTDKHTYYGKESEIHNTCNWSDNCDLKVYRLYNVYMIQVVYAWK